MKSRMIDETGNRYGRLIVLRKSHGNGPTYWSCRCDCGNQRAVSGSALRGGRTMSCGCLNSEMSKQRATERNITHGHNAPGSAGISSTYITWQAMIQRCTDPNVYQWDRYGGRGVTFCGRWKKYENFLADMGERSSISRSRVAGRDQRITELRARYVPPRSATFHHAPRFSGPLPR
jgi:hypothetical protein